MIADLPHALRDSQQFAARLNGRKPAVFLDYDGTLTPIVDRPEDAVISEEAVQYLRHALHVDGAEFVPGYLGDDITDEDAFQALKGPTNGAGIGVIVADTADPEQASRATAAEFVLESIGEVQQFLDTLA
ncbi:MAG: hypothetical protein ACRDRA_22070 [Pseudonocardiaceae bacterium]